MQKVLATGKWLFILSFLLYTGLHFGLPQVGADMIPSFFPGRLFLELCNRRADHRFYSELFDW